MKEGRAAFAERRLNEATLALQQAINYFKETENLLMYAKCLNILGVIYATLGNETMAIDYYLEGLECSIQNQFSHITTLFYNNIGSRYQELNEHERAINYFLRAEKELESEEVKREETYTTWALVTNLNLLLSYTELKDFKRAEHYLKKTWEYLDEEEESEYHFSVMISQYWLYWLEGKEELVREHLDEIIDGALKD